MAITNYIHVGARPESTSSGATYVSDLGAVGNFEARVMQPVVQASASTANADEFFYDATGFSAFRFHAGTTITAGEAIVCAVSTDTASDLTDLKTLIDSVTTTTTGDWDAPDGTALSSCIILGNGRPATDWIFAPAGSKFYNFGFELTAAISGMNVVLELVR